MCPILITDASIKATCSGSFVARSLVVSVEFLKLPQTSPALPSSLSLFRFPSLVPGVYSYGIENTRLTIRRRSFVMLANYPARHTSNSVSHQDAGVSHGRRRGRVDLGFSRRAATAKVRDANSLICKLMTAWLSRRRKLHRRAVLTLIITAALG